MPTSETMSARFKVRPCWTRGAQISCKPAAGRDVQQASGRRHIFGKGTVRPLLPCAVEEHDTKAGLSEAKWERENFGLGEAHRGFSLARSCTGVRRGDRGDDGDVARVTVAWRGRGRVRARRRRGRRGGSRLGAGLDEVGVAVVARRRRSRTEAWRSARRSGAGPSRRGRGWLRRRGALRRGGRLCDVCGELVGEVTQRKGGTGVAAPWERRERRLGQAL